MDRQEAIKAWKANTTAWCWVSSGMRSWAKQLVDGLEVLDSDGESENWIKPNPSFTPFAEDIFRLRPDYTEEPEEIVCEVRPDKAERYLFIEYCGMLVELTSAVAFIPAKGFRFDRAVFSSGHISYDSVTIRMCDRTVHAVQVVYRKQ